MDLSSRSHHVADLFFSAYDDQRHRVAEVRRTERGPPRQDIRDGTWFPSSLSSPNVGRTLFFSANDETNGYELWKSDGTEVGTNTSSRNSSVLMDPYPCLLTNVGGDFVLLRPMTTPTATSCGKSDGTEEGTTLVKDNSRTGIFVPTHAISPRGRDLCSFSANDETQRLRSCEVDGTEEGTTLRPRIFQDGANGSYLGISPRGRDFVSSPPMTQTNGYELWKVRRDDKWGTTLVKDIRTGIFGSNPHASSLAEV